MTSVREGLRIYLLEDFLEDLVGGYVIDAVFWVGAVREHAPSVGFYGDGTIVSSIGVNASGIGTAEDEDQRFAKGGCDVARAGVVADNEFCISH